MNNFSKWIGIAIFAFSSMHSAQAGLIGDQVGIRYFGAAGDTGVRSVTVGTGEEGSFFGNQFFNFGDFSFSIRSTVVPFACGIFSCLGPVSLQLSDLDFGQPLTGVALSTSLTGVNVVFGSDFVSFNWNEQNLTPSTYLSASFNVSQVPEPASLALFGIGLAGLGALRHKSRA